MSAWKQVSFAAAFALYLSVARAQVTQLISVNSSGQEGSDTSSKPSITPDGRFVVFASSASNLVTGDTNDFRDVFVRDRLAGTTERVSVDSSGVQGNGASGLSGLSISADGRHVVFDSNASNLVPGDIYGRRDVFVHDRQTGMTDVVNVYTTGGQASGGGLDPSISADGRYVAFVSVDILDQSEGNFDWDVFVRDLQNATTERISVPGFGSDTTAPSSAPSISADGRYVAFVSPASNLIPGDTNGFYDIFVRDRQSGTTERASVDSAGGEANDSSGYSGTFTNPSISADDRFVVFPSWATNLVPGDANGRTDIFVHDRLTGTTERVSVDSSGVEGNDTSGVAGQSISADGRYVAFPSRASNLVAGDSNAANDIFVRDRLGATTERVSVSFSGAQSDGDSGLGGGHYNGTELGRPSISGDGRYVAFGSHATNLIPADSNGVEDIFVRDRVGGPSFVSMCNPGVGGVIPCPCSNPAGGFGQGCDNSASTGGALLTASGGTYLSSDSLVFVSLAQRSTELSILIQGNALIPAGVVYGQGVRCSGGALKRLYTKTASGGSITAPDFNAGDPQVSVRSAALGDTILAGQSRWYLVYYRDPIVLGGCPATSTFNATQTGQVTWSP